MKIEAESGGSTHQQPGVLDNTQLFCPLSQPLLPPQEGTDAGILHQLDGGLRGWPLMGC